MFGNVLKMPRKKKTELNENRVKYAFHVVINNQPTTFYFTEALNRKKKMKEKSLNNFFRGFFFAFE